MARPQSRQDVITVRPVQAEDFNACPLFDAEITLDILPYGFDDARRRVVCDNDLARTRLCGNEAG